MSLPAGRPVLAKRTVAALVAAMVLAACASEGPKPARTLEIAGETSIPSAAAATASNPSTRPDASLPGVPPEPRPSPTSGPDSGPTTPPAGTSAILPGTVNRTSLDIRATYHVNAAITVRSGALDVTTRIVATNESGEGIDRLELNTIAARLGGIKVSASVDQAPVKVAVKDQTLIVPLGGILPAGASATITVGYRATLRSGVLDGDWMFTRNDGTLALYRWIPWVSRALPFDRPNNGEPFLTVSSPRVDVELLTDAPMILAAPAVSIEAYAAGAGNAWSFGLTDVRDVSIVLAPEFHVATGKVDGIPIRAYTKPGGLSASQLVEQAKAAISSQSDLLGVKYPWTTLTIVETPGGVGIEAPGIVWIPDRLDLRNRTYALAQGVAHQWFEALVGNDQRNEPFADEAPADLLARTTLGTLRATRCARAALDKSIGSYSTTCYYEVVLVQGGRLLDDLRRRMGTKAFWRAMGGYVEANRNGLGGTRQLLDALRAGSPVNLLPLITPRFPTLY
ncbi:MAG: hypothetical protein ABI620_00330 [Chloroflexota bacterium]